LWLGLSKLIPFLPEKLHSKPVYYKHWSQGGFGNKPRTWDSLVELEQSDYPDTALVTMRYRQSLSTFMTYGVPAGQARTLIEKFVREDGAQEQLFVFNEAMPDEYITVQGELIQRVGGYYLFYSTVPGRMGKVLRSHGQHAEGLKVNYLLKQYADPSSLEDIITLLDNYPDACVEFSCYSRYVGNIPHRNTVIWEVREY
jgi:hypothetical protein